MQLLSKVEEYNRNEGVANILTGRGSLYLYCREIVNQSMIVFPQLIQTSLSSLFSYFYVTLNDRRMRHGNFPFQTTVDAHRNVTDFSKMSSVRARFVLNFVSSRNDSFFFSFIENRYRRPFKLRMDLRFLTGKWKRKIYLSRDRRRKYCFAKIEY